MKNKMVKAFSLVEIVIGLALLGVAIGGMATLLNAISKQREQVSLDSAIFQLGKGINDAVKLHPDSFTLSHEYVILKNSDNEQNYLAIPKSRWVPMVSLENANGIIGETRKDAVNAKGEAITDGYAYMNKLRDFWGVPSFNSENTPFLFISQKFLETARGTIPYNDFYVLMLPNDISKPLKTMERAKRDKIIGALVLTEGRVCGFDTSTVALGGEEVKVIKKLADCTPYRSSGNGGGATNNFDPSNQYLDVTSMSINIYQDKEGMAKIKEALENAGGKYISMEDLTQARSQIRIISYSNRQNILDLFEKTAKTVDNYAKNLKDWASIQMGMYENTVAKIGGSFNIDYFITRTDKTTGTDDTFYKIGTNEGEYIATALYSSPYLSKVDCGSTADAKSDICWETTNNLIKIKNDKGVNSTLYGIAVENFEYNSDETKLNRGLYNIKAIGRGVLKGTANGKESLIDFTKKGNLMAGSQMILGVNATEKGFGNSFGDVYRYGFSNVRKYGVSEGAGAGQYLWEQNKPDSPTAYAPYTAVVNTTFPWIYFKIKPDDNFFGYYENRVVPELR